MVRGVRAAVVRLGSGRADERDGVLRYLCRCSSRSKSRAGGTSAAGERSAWAAAAYRPVAAVPPMKQALAIVLLTVAGYALILCRLVVAFVGYASLEGRALGGELAP